MISLLKRLGRRGGAATKRNAPPSSGDWGEVVTVPLRPADKEGEGDSSDVDGRSPEGITRKQRRELMSSVKGRLRDYPHLVAIKPDEGYVFRSDYFDVDDGVACIMGYFHNDAARDNLVPFWGVSRIPYLSDDVSVILLEQVSRKSENWIDERRKKSDMLTTVESNNQESNSSRASRRKLIKSNDDLNQIEEELANGGSYMVAHYRILIKAPDLDTLDETIDRIRRQYVDGFGNLSVAPYHGEQRQELSNLLAPSQSKHGKGFGFTSQEIAGSFNLVTNGLNDKGGEYVGYMVGDVNNSAVLLDADLYRGHVVIADDDRSKEPRMRDSHVADMWGSKLSQACLINNHKVVHLVLNGADLPGTLGPRMRSITTVIDMNNGDVNPFELFGSRRDQLSLFSAHVQKLVLLAEQAYETTDSDRSIIRANLESTLTRFYTDRGMWYHNAKENQDRLRIVGIPHDHVPRLQLFVAYLDQRHKQLSQASARDDEELHAYSVLSAVFKNLLNNNGDLFNTITSSSIDSVGRMQRVIYDFSSLQLRGAGIAMAQFVNVLAYATSSLGKGDSLFIHGAELISPGVRDYMTVQLDHLRRRQGRVVWCYGKIDKALDDAAFNEIVKADYTVLGALTPVQLEHYQKVLKQDIPVDMQGVITQRGRGYSFLRRGATNVVFDRDLPLGLSASSRDPGAMTVPGRSRAVGASGGK